jgi:hypothetical protein
MTKYIIVSGGVVSGIGKGVIGLCLQAYLRNPEFETPTYSFVHWSSVEDDRVEGHGYQNRSVHECRCRNHEADRAR